MRDKVEKYLHVISHYINTLLMVSQLFMAVSQRLMQLLYAGLQGPILTACKGRQQGLKDKFIKLRICIDMTIMQIFRSSQEL